MRLPFSYLEILAVMRLLSLPWKRPQPAMSPNAAPAARARRERCHQAYWDALAPIYDDLYGDRWCRLEDSSVSEMIADHLPCRRIAVLDLGCGTGLGHQLTARDGLECEYHGRDLSLQMLEHCYRRVPDARLVHGMMSDLSDYGAASFDVVLCLSSSFSYTGAPNDTILEAFRVLRPGGLLHLSALSRFALWRIVRANFAHEDWHQTRRIVRRANGVPATYYTTGELKRLVQAAGFAVIDLRGLNALSGLVESPAIWKFGRLIAQVLPDVAYSFELVGRRPA
jgi:SAM-dependent methyltransferase